MKGIPFVLLICVSCFAAGHNQTDIDQPVTEDALQETTLADYAEDEDEEEEEAVEPNQPESKILEKGTLVEGGNKRKKMKRRRGPSKKMAQKLLPLLMIPLMIQSQMMPMMLLKLKLMAIKAVMIGKFALLLLAFNVIRNAMIGADDIDQQYEQNSLSHSHYGYNGGPEYGSWVNKRRRRR